MQRSYASRVPHAVRNLLPNRWDEDGTASGVPRVVAVMTAACPLHSRSTCYRDLNVASMRRPHRQWQWAFAWFMETFNCTIQQHHQVYPVRDYQGLSVMLLAIIFEDRQGSEDKELHWMGRRQHFTTHPADVVAFAYVYVQTMYVRP